MIDPEARLVPIDRLFGLINSSFVSYALVLVADLLVFYPSVFLVLRRLLPTAVTDDRDRLVALLLVLINPTLVLIDHGHFQYNSLSLGLAQLAIGCVFAATSGGHKRFVYASALFTLALNYKQMELYHALPFFFYLLGVCLKQDSLLKRFHLRTASLSLSS